MSDEVVRWLQPRQDGVYVDCTLGLGGTALSILKACAPGGFLIGIDQDPKAVEVAGKRLGNFSSRFRVYCENFSNVKHMVRAAGKDLVDGVVFDLGVSSYQLEDPARGLSFLRDGPLNMRLDGSRGETAADLVNSLTESELASLIFQYGEERYSRRIAKAISRARRISPLHRTKELVNVIEGAVPASYRQGRLHPATRTFQALRIAVNHELEILERAIRDAVDMLASGGRVCVISFHSLEDRIVKQVFRSLSRAPESLFTLLTKKPLVPSREECKENPRARSAKMRVIERKPFNTGECMV